jgi:signal transduction histidine kinase
MLAEAPSASWFTWDGQGEERGAMRQIALTEKTAHTTEPAAAMGRTLTLVRWFTIAALFLIALAQPVLGRTGLPTWILILLFACYSGAIALLCRLVWWLRSFQHMAVVDLLVVGALYTLDASPGGTLFVLFLLITVMAAATSPLRLSLLYTVAVLVVLVVVSPPHLPLSPTGVAATRDLLARFVVLALASTTTALLVHQLEAERRVAEASRAEAARHAELNRVTGIFISSISHDLRTPLTALGAGLGMLEMSVGERLQPEEERLLATARRNSERLNLLIDDLLTYNQLEAGAMQLTSGRLDLREVVLGVVSTVRPLLDEKCQSVQLDMPAPLSYDGDARRLEQVLVNLIANAHEHAPAGTNIAITGHVQPHELIIEVFDDGPGIPVEERERIFERFHRLAPTRRGSGLGLAIAKSIVQLHGGRIWAESASETGVRFSLALPTDEAEVSQHAPEAARSRRRA